MFIIAFQYMYIKNSAKIKNRTLCHNNLVNKDKNQYLCHVVLDYNNLKAMQGSNSKNKKVKVLFVCLGNICRSPAAEGIFKKMVTDANLNDDIYVDSAGTSGWHENELPDDRMRKHGALRGYDFSSRSRKFIHDDFKQFDYIIVMDDDNYANAIKLAKNEIEKSKVYKMSDFLTDFSHDLIPDPYFGGSSGFELVMDLLEDACSKLLEDIVAKIK